MTLHTLSNDTCPNAQSATYADESFLQCAENWQKIYLLTSIQITVRDCKAAIIMSSYIPSFNSNSLKISTCPLGRYIKLFTMQYVKIPKVMQTGCWPGANTFNSEAGERTQASAKFRHPSIIDDSGDSPFVDLPPSRVPTWYQLGLEEATSESRL
ncbi:hypothetical protein C8J55DRAFT_549999 [Lentinula edodes]|uniref:Uncharacterized protein n=1 Tax=Lentinula lateritia TaxID=40482 RepID=A0A9W9AB15_9AGAR|nr:hypothetical protein C8J55DRAFT_549999 [Lentinula edodes]